MTVLTPQLWSKFFAEKMERLDKVTMEDARSIDEIFAAQANERRAKQRDQETL